jgi:3-hydroxyisobutyrate dehydrogenase-like beta-hydroxyacid dehydrogenase
MVDKDRICLLGFGEVGQVLAADLLAAGVRRLTAWDVQFTNPESAPARAARSSQVTLAADPNHAVREASLVLSAVTAAQDVAAAKSVVPYISNGAMFVDLNSVSPGVKRQVATIIEQSSRGRYVEAAIMSPIAPKRIASPILLGGPHAQQFADTGRSLGFTGLEVFSDTIGKASAAKMCRSVVVKGMEALLTESLLAARSYGVEQTVIESLKNLFPSRDWPALARYMISRSLIHGTRRAEEMRCVKSLRP